MQIEFIDNSEFFKEEMQSVCLQVLEEWGMVGEGYAKLLCPVDTGNLRNSIAYLVVVGTLTVYIGTNSEYGPYVELGTGIYYAGGRKDPWVYQDAKGQWHLTYGQRAQPYLKPAVADHVQEYKKILESRLHG